MLSSLTYYFFLNITFTLSGCEQRERVPRWSRRPTIQARRDQHQDTRQQSRRPRQTRGTS